MLVAGGYDSSAFGCCFLNSAEIDDPGHGHLVAYRLDDTGRWDPTATRLSDGRVLVTGGRNDSGKLASAEIYDPVTETWSTTSSIRVLLARGTRPRSSQTAACSSPRGSTSARSWPVRRLTIPATGTWSVTGSLGGFARSRHTATLLSDGRVLVAGGENGDYIHFYLPFAEIYDPATGTWSVTGSMIKGRQGHRATLLADSSVLVTGGFGEAGGLASAEIYRSGDRCLEPDRLDAGTDREEHTATLLSDSRVLVAGSFRFLSGALASAEIYDPVTGTWSLTASMNIARQSHQGTRLADGRVIVVGGDTFNGGPFASAEIFSYDSNVLTVAIDIKPNALPNTINLGSNGTVAVAILSTPSFDATTVDPGSVTLASAPVKLRGQAAPMASFDDVNGDGLPDLVLHVSTQSMVLSFADVEAILEGMTFDGTKIKGVDTIRIVP